MIIYRSIDDDNDHRGASRMILSFFSPSQYADQGDWESARVSSVDGMTIRLMRNDVVREKKNNESYF